MKSLMEQLSENPLQAALVENEELREQLAKANEQLQSVCNHNATQQPEITRLRAELAKANESVAELEHEKESLNMRVSKQKEVIKRYAKEAIETAKAQEAFAIENQIKGATLFSSSANETGQFGWSDCQWLSDYAEEFAEQLRKEQDKC